IARSSAIFASRVPLAVESFPPVLFVPHEDRLEGPMSAEAKPAAPTSLASPPATTAGRIWFAIQGAIALGLLLAPVFSRTQASPVLRGLGLAIAVLGILLLVRSYRALGNSHSPWTTPLEGANIVTSGPYRTVRHPVYSAYILTGLGLEVMFASPV